MAPEWLGTLAVAAITIAAACAWVFVLHRIHEGQTWWSGISTQEQELTFVSEQAFYYYYFKRSLPLAKPLTDVVRELLYDDTVENPAVCNALRRFTVYPELALALVWRMLASWGAAPLPTEFYKAVSLGANALLPAAVVATAHSLGAGVPGAAVCVVMLFANLEHVTRAPSAVALRETLAIPLLLLQIAALVRGLDPPDEGDEGNGGRLTSLTFIASTALCLLSWQLCANLFLLELLSLLGVYAAGHLTPAAARSVLTRHAIAAAAAAAFLFLNGMLLASWYVAVLAAFLLAVVCFPLRHPPAATYLSRVLRGGFHAVVVVAVAIALRGALQRAFAMEDDAHIFNLVKAKMGTFRDFHTTIYLRIVAFQALPLATYRELLATGLLAGALGTAAVALGDTAAGLGRPHPPALGFLTLLAVAFGILANLFIRLKMLWTPLLCVLCGLFPVVAQRLVTHAPVLGRAARRSPGVVPVATAAALVAVGVWGSDNFAVIRGAIAHEGSYNREVVLSLADHIRRRTPPDANVFGDMITTSAVVLMTGRRVAIHPHYEDRAIRHKIYMTYHWAAYRHLADVHRILTGYNITHVVDTPHLCFQNWGPGSPSYASLVEEGEYGLPPPSLPRAPETCCRAARRPNPYFQLLETVADDKSPDGRVQFRLYRVLPSP